jgi:hypothetical protein
MKAENAFALVLLGIVAIVFLAITYVAAHFVIKYW